MHFLKKKQILKLNVPICHCVMSWSTFTSCLAEKFYHWLQDHRNPLTLIKKKKKHGRIRQTTSLLARGKVLLLSLFLYLIMWWPMIECDIWSSFNITPFLSSPFPDTVCASAPLEFSPFSEHFCDICHNIDNMYCYFGRKIFPLFLFFFCMGWISAFRLFCRYLARYTACSVYLTGYLVVVRQDFWLVEICQVGYLTDYRFFSLHFPNIGPNIFQISGLSLNLPCAICV